MMYSPLKMKHKKQESNPPGETIENVKNSVILRKKNVHWENPEFD
jgi:hypothetical protein